MYSSNRRLLQMELFLGLAALQLVAVCFGYTETTVGHVTKFLASEFGDEDDSRLVKRSSQDLGETVFLEFEGIGKRFGLLLESNSDLLPENSMVRVYRNGTFEESPVQGRAYVGRRLVVLNEGNKAMMASMLKKSDKSNNENPFAHFYLEKDEAGKIVAQGGFVHKGQFYQVNHESHPAKPKPKKHTLAVDEEACKEDRLVVSAQPVSEMKGFGEVSGPDGTVKRYQCGHDSLHWNTDEHGASSYFEKALEAKVSNSTLSLDGRLQARAFSTGCPVNKKTLLVGIVADCNYVRAFQGNRGKIQMSIINEFSMVSGIYEKSFNINLGIMSIDLMADCDANDNSWNSVCKPMHMLGEQMSKFSKYREGLRKDVGVYHLVTDCLHTEVVGIAWLNQVCRTDTFTSGRDFVSGTSASTLIKNHFAVIAHEIAHNLGAIHDCNKDACLTCDVTKGNCDCCPCGPKCDCNDKFIMSPGSGTVDVREFSQCTLDWVCKKMPILATCLVKPGLKKTLKLGQCGNGIREDDEECDCGSPEMCAKDPCCMEGCKLRKGATCSDSNDPCCRKCQIIPASEKFVCGKSSGFCQFSSFCTGERECPQTKTRPNGTPCRDVPGGRCSAGLCTSRDAQCQAVGGQLGVTKACDTTFNGCELVCKGASDKCIAFKATFSDGVQCGANGFCKDGVCSESIVVTAATKYWLALVVIAGFFLAAVLACVLASCNRRRNLY